MALIIYEIYEITILSNYSVSKYVHNRACVRATVYATVCVRQWVRVIVIVRVSVIVRVRQYGCVCARQCAVVTVCLFVSDSDSVSDSVSECLCTAAVIQWTEMQRGPAGCCSSGGRC